VVEVNDMLSFSFDFRSHLNLLPLAFRLHQNVDYVKLDSCIHKGGHIDSQLREELTPQFARALDASGRKMWLNFHCNGAYQVSDSI
jgi:hypothetical protein